jgi:hypothetical protein
MSAEIRHFPPPGWKRHFPELVAAEREAARHRRRVEHWLAHAVADLQRLGASSTAMGELHRLAELVIDEGPSELP